MFNIAKAYRFQGYYVLKYILLLLLIVTVLALFLFEDSSWFRGAPRFLHLFILH